MASVRLASTMEISSTASKATRTDTVVAPMAGNTGLIYTQTATTSSALIVQTTTFGYCMIKNLDATNYVEWGPDDGGTIRVLGRIQPGEFVMAKLNQATRMQTNTGTALCEIVSLDR